MNYERPELRDLLAGEYVLGHLRGRARARFERLLLERPAVASAVADWEERLAPLAAGVEPVAPPGRVWRRIARRIGPRHRRRFRVSPAAGGFAAAAVAAAAFFVVLGLYLSRPPAPALPNRVAVISTAQGTPRWVITVRRDRMHMHTVGNAAPPSGKSYELWMIPGGGAKPVSLGVLPASGEASESLSPAMLRALAKSSGLAVSVEPAGGSPTGRPTGPVVYTAALVSA